jgi:hypothetical protein
MLGSIQPEDPRAAEALLPSVYEELRTLAAHKMATQPPGHTLQPTALVHEAWMRLAANESARFAGRAHFFAAVAADDELLAVHDVLDRLAAEEPQRAQMAKLRYFAGLTFEEVAEVLGISVPTAKRHWTYARAWLYAEIKANQPG